ncbi:MAG: hypothetical protein RJA07_1524 [Bacteroidota bacterium]|jgi:hypothetical protein
MLFTKKYLLLLVVIFFATNNTLFAQHYSIYPNDTAAIGNTVLTSTVTRNFNLKHTQNDTLVFHWKKLSVTMPTNWDAGICDYQHCYTTLRDSGITDKVIPSDDCVMAVHCTPYINTGTAIIRYTFYEKNSPLIIDTLTWIFNCTTTGIINTVAQSLIITTAPQKVMLRNVDEAISNIHIFDESGKEIYQTEKIKSAMEIQIPSSSSHIYFVQFNTKQNSFTKKIIVNP